MENKQLYVQYLNSMQVQYITGGYFKANSKWNTTEKLKVNKFYYVTDGEFELTINEQVFIVKKGQLVMIPADMKHSYKLTTKNTMSKYWCHFEALSGTDGFFNTVKTDLIVDIGIDKNLISLFKKLYEYEKNTNTISGFSSRATLMLIIARYLEKCQCVYIENNSDNSNLSSVVDYMKTNLTENISINKLAEITHLHPNYFIRLFKQYYGASPIKYFNNMKIAEAKKHLKRSNLTIEEISKTMGFADLYTFSKFFKNNVGISPSQFRCSNVDNIKS